MCDLFKKVSEIALIVVLFFPYFLCCFLFLLFLYPSLRYFGIFNEECHEKYSFACACAKTKLRADHMR